MKGKRGLFLKTVRTEMRLSCTFEKMPAAQTIRWTTSIGLLPAGAANNLFLGSFKECRTQLAERGKEN